jgi:2,3-bisphosphoglycerate-independent phosphoglycerate mutase
LDAAIKAVETVDSCLGEIVTALNKVGGQMLLTADHGNIEQMLDEETGQPHVGGSKPLLEGGSLADLAPTMLAILGVQQPVEMTGRSLIGQ